MIGKWSYRLIRALCLTVPLLLSLPARAEPEIVIGDSIACGVKDAGHLLGGCHVGASPIAVLHMVLSYPADNFKGQIVILSSGASNNPSQTDLALTMVAYLHSHGARVVLLGVGSRIPNSGAINDALKFYTTTADGIFIWGWSDVHPGSYGEVLRLIRAEECKYWKICSI